MTHRTSRIRGSCNFRDPATQIWLHAFRLDIGLGYEAGMTVSYIGIRLCYR